MARTNWSLQYICSGIIARDAFMRVSFRRFLVFFGLRILTPRFRRCKVCRVVDGDILKLNKFRWLTWILRRRTKSQLSRMLFVGAWSLRTQRRFGPTERRSGHWCFTYAASCWRWRLCDPSVAMVMRIYCSAPTISWAGSNGRPSAHRTTSVTVSSCR